MENEPWLTAAEAAALLGVSESTALTDAKEGRIESRDQGRGRRPRWLLSRAAVEALRAAGGRFDRRRAPGRADEPQSEPSAELNELRTELDASRREIQRLRAEVARLKETARNANVAVQVQTSSLQQYLVEDQIT